MLVIKRYPPLQYPTTSNAQVLGFTIFPVPTNPGTTSLLLVLTVSNAECAKPTAKRCHIRNAREAFHLAFSGMPAHFAWAIAKFMREGPTEIGGRFKAELVGNVENSSTAGWVRNRCMGS